MEDAVDPRKNGVDDNWFAAEVNEAGAWSEDCVLDRFKRLLIAPQTTQPHTINAQRPFSIGERVDRMHTRHTHLCAPTEMRENASRLGLERRPANAVSIAPPLTALVSSSSTQ